MTDLPSGLSQTARIARLIEDNPAVAEVEHAEGREERQFWVTFDQPALPYGFADLYGLEFVTAWWTSTRLRLREYLMPKTRVGAHFVKPIERIDSLEGTDD